MNTIAVYPGSFDPITNGHLDIVSRALTRVRLGRRRASSPTRARRRCSRSTSGSRSSARRSRRSSARPQHDRVEVQAFDGLTVDFARARDAGAIVRGLRAISDFETEIQLAHNNRVLAPEVDTVFFMTAVEHGYVSSSLVKEIAGFGGDVSGMVPAAAREALAKARPRTVGGH